MSGDYEYGEYVILPRGISTKDKPLVILNKLDAKGKRIPDRLAFGVDKITRLWRVGHVYSIPSTNEGKSFAVAQAKWLRQYEDSAQVATWQGEQAADDLDAAARALEKKEAKPTSELEKAFKILRCAYQGVAPHQRTAFDAYVLNQIRKY